MLALVPLLLLAPCTVAAASRPLPASVQEMLAGTEFGGRYALSDLVTSTPKEGNLCAEIHLPDSLSRLVEREGAAERPVRIAVEGSDLTWSVKSYGEVGPNRTLSLVCYDAVALAPFQCVALHVKPHLVKLYGMSFDFPGTQGQFELSRQVDGIGFSWQIAGGATQNGQAASLSELRQRYPDFARTVLAPLMRRLGVRGLAVRHSPAEVFLALPSLRPDPGVADRVRKLLPDLGAHRAAVREAASAELDRLGRPATMAVFRLDRSALTPEQNARLQLFLRAGGDAPPARPPVVGVDFLIDCLDDDDPQVRATAKRQLETASGRPIRFDLSLAGEARAAAVEALFETIPGRGDRSSPARGDD